MPQKTKIEWTDYSSNVLMAVRKSDGKRGWACTKVSSGCDHCYSEDINRRFGTGLAYTPENEEMVDFAVSEKELAALLSFKKTGAKVFVCDMTDLFHRKVTDEMLDQCFDMFEATPNFTKQILTKRPQRMRSYLVKRWADKEPPSHIWLGASVEAQDQKWRIETLAQTPAAVRFLSAEPLIEDLGLLSLTGIHQVIIGGESGARARWCDLQWIRNVKSQAKRDGAAVFVKQVGSLPGAERHHWGNNGILRSDGLRKGSMPEGYVALTMDDSKGGDWAEWTEDLRVRQFPVAA